MKRSRIIIVAVIIVMAGLYVALFAQEDSRPPYTEFLHEDQYQACGLSKLSEGELLNLVGVVRGWGGISYLGEGAHNYMKRQGWYRTELLGYQKLNLSDATMAPREYLLAYREGRLHILDLPITGRRLDPGVYWSKGGGSTWWILTPEGEESSHWVRESGR